MSTSSLTELLQVVYSRHGSTYIKHPHLSEIERKLLDPLDQNCKAKMMREECFIASSFKEDLTFRLKIQWQF